MILLTPIRYTSHEGGAWRPWEGGSIQEFELLLMTNSKNAYPYKDPVFGFPHPFRLTTIHSLAFHDPIDKPMNSYARWDCINGWTTTLEEIEEMNKGV